MWEVAERKSASGCAESLGTISFPSSESTASPRTRALPTPAFSSAHSGWISSGSAYTEQRTAALGKSSSVHSEVPTVNGVRRNDTGGKSSLEVPGGSSELPAVCLFSSIGVDCSIESQFSHGWNGRKKHAVFTYLQIGRGRARGLQDFSWTRKPGKQEICKNAVGMRDGAKRGSDENRVPLSRSKQFQCSAHDSVLGNGHRVSMEPESCLGTGS